MNATAQTKPNSTVELLSARTLAQRAGVHHGTIFRWAAAGLLTPVKINPRVVRFRIDEFERLVSNSSISRSTAPAHSAGGGAP